VGRLSDEISRLEKQLDELAAASMSSRGYFSEESRREYYRLVERWWRGEDLSDEDPKDVAGLDEFGPIAAAVGQGDFIFDGTVDQYAERFLTPRAAEARRKRLEDEGR
jgi:hypothetical protein